MKKVYAQDKKVVKEKIQGEKAKEKTDRTLKSSKKNLEQSSSVSDTFCIICLEPYSKSASGEIWKRCIIHSKKGLVDPTNGLLINTLYDVFKQHIPLVGIVRITM